MVKGSGVTDILGGVPHEQIPALGTDKHGWASHEIMKDGL